MFQKHQTTKNKIEKWTFKNPRYHFRGRVQEGKCWSPHYRSRHFDRTPVRCRCEPTGRKRERLQDTHEDSLAPADSPRRSRVPSQSKARFSSMIEAGPQWKSSKPISFSLKVLETGSLFQTNTTGFETWNILKSSTERFQHGTPA